jgi:hypothetical protein
LKNNRSRFHCTLVLGGEAILMYLLYTSLEGYRVWESDRDRPVR